jgi:hypothetical protein
MRIARGEGHARRPLKLIADVAKLRAKIYRWFDTH